VAQNDKKGRARNGREETDSFTPLERSLTKVLNEDRYLNEEYLSVRILSRFMEMWQFCSELGVVEG